MNENEMKNFAVKLPSSELERAMQVLQQMGGATKGEAFSKMLDIVQAELSGDCAEDVFKSHLHSISNALEHVQNEIVAIIATAAEQRNHDRAELHEKVNTLERSIAEYQDTIDTLKGELADAQAKNVADANALEAAEQHNADANAKLAVQAADYEARLEEQRQRVQEQSDLIALQRAQLELVKDSQQAY